MNAVFSISARVIALAAAGAISGCAIPSAETLSPFQQPWPWTKVIAVNRTGHDVLVVRAGHCETGPVARRSQSTPSFCFLGTRPDGPIAIDWTDAGSDAGSDTAADTATDPGAAHVATAPLPRLWQEDPRPEDATAGFLCILLRDDARVNLTIATTAEACAVL